MVKECIRFEVHFLAKVGYVIERKKPLKNAVLMILS